MEGTHQRWARRSGVFLCFVSLDAQRNEGAVRGRNPATLKTQKLLIYHIKAAMTGTANLRKFLKLTLKQWLILILVVPGIPFLLISLFIVIYSTMPWPTGETVTMQKVDSHTKELIVLVHGKGDNPSSWADSFAAELNLALLGDGQQALTINWSDYSNDLFRSTLNARRIGQDLGRKLAALKHLKRLHLIGHSAGSFVVYGICEAVKPYREDLFVHTTFLDPVGIYAGIDWGYGTRNFGSCADISDAYIDREDGVPGSNAPLDHPHTFDVTALRKKSSFKELPHLWPIEYYRQQVVEQKLPYWEPKVEVLKMFPASKYTLME